MEFKDKITLITGAGSGIGRTTAMAFAQEGAEVIVSDVNSSGGEETVARIKAAGGKATFIKADVSDFEQMKTLHQEIESSFGIIDIAINNAGIAGPLASLTDTSIEDWGQVMAINASGVFYGMKLQIAQMLKKGAGCIVNISSIAGLKGLPKSSAYSAAKHAVLGLTKTAAMEFGKKNIRINAVCPVFTVTPLFDPEKIDQISDGLADKLKKSIPMKRFGEPQEIADAILWLCSEKASFVNGISLPIDGGHTA